MYMYVFPMPSCSPQDSSGRTALHVSILCKKPRCSDILLAHPSIDLSIRDKKDQTPFASALAVQDNEAGKAILQRQPNAAEQVWNTLVLLHTHCHAALHCT